MNDPISPTSSLDSTEQIAALQRQVFLLLVALIVLTATIVFYLGCQSIFTSHDFTRARPTDALMIQQYSRNALEIQNFEKQLISYGQTHPSFQPILRQYGLMPPPAAPASTAPAP
jgi:hypothetical protein